MACLTLLPTTEFNSPCETIVIPCTHERAQKLTVYLGFRPWEGKARNTAQLLPPQLHSLTDKVHYFLRTEFELQIAFTLFTWTT